jgi:hypothetical protein
MTNVASKYPDWPGAMKRSTAVAYLDVSDAGFKREIAAGYLPEGFILVVDRTGAERTWIRS